MMKQDLEELTIRYNLVKSKEWQAIRERVLNNIVKYSKTATEPQLIQGMLIDIHDVDKWEEDFLDAKQGNGNK